MTDELFQIPATHPPALEAARRRLMKLESERDATLREAEPGGYDGELEWSQEWQLLLRRIKEAAADIAHHEAVESITAADCRLETEGRG